MPEKLPPRQKPHRRAQAPARPTPAGTELPPEIDEPVTPDGEPVRVQLRTPARPYDIPGEILGGLAMQWYYMVRHRRRWADSPSAKKSLMERALTGLEGVGITRTMLADLGKAGMVEVAIPYRAEGEGWAARILPWEFLLRTATGKPDLTVIRHLDVKGRTPRAVTTPPNSLLFVKSAPGPLGAYDFDTERCLVEGSLCFGNPQELDDPQAQELSDQIRNQNPQVIHLAGFDLHQGDELYNYSVKPQDRIPDEDDAARWDGMYFAGGDQTTVDRVRAERLGKLVNPPGAGGALVSFNLYHSAARTAAMAVANGSAAAIGFQDVVDDSLAERFFASFYQQWRALEWDLLAAFHQAWRRIGLSGREDCGVVLWSAGSIIGKQLTGRKVSPAAKLEIGADKEDAFRVHVEPNPEINYSLLHNGEGLFETFRFEKYQPCYAQDIKVEVDLHLGTESFPYRANFDLDADDPVLDIAAHVNLPLTSQLARSLREDLLTSLRVCISYEGRELYQETHRVKLLAINQWRFDQSEGGRWLASFVMPGDPAVTRIVDLAQKYLMALRDDPGAGFDGYQSTDPQNLERRDEGVDMQVRALWAALSFDLPLSYINPPPVFTEGSQRLRTPLDVVNGKRGTCIDLAVLFAACLEYVDIYPVIFVLTDHAFPGYWRNEQSYQDYLAMSKAPESTGGYGAYDASATAQKRLRFEEVSQWVRDGALVPIETVWLTTHRGFAEAVDAGIDNLRSSRSFEALVNIRKLRDEGVTPLPIAGELR